ncbi:hypothetical protein CCR97_01480 [Rhodoplanes elegans]|uniref:Helix-turn-helix domain-containing protein n=1 Tax=Rhodoplanes elegans TaxID=29408 RepID=A0A327KHA8_9BRAD|nr:DNA-binding protein [Rhodoplanes elegans]MBK5956890.1 hypothetical protein [Rhodoplanes elegans]RAI38070.1 hypothetical protein CH338_13925 [Rhodoplanes elegans]
MADLVPARHGIDRRARDISKLSTGHPDDLITTAQLAAWLGVSIQWAEIGRSKGWGPPYIKLGRRVAYRRGSVLAWLAERERAHQKPPGTPTTKAAANSAAGA